MFSIRCLWRPDLLLAVLVTLMGLSLSLASARGDVGVIGDDKQDAFVGSGSLVLPPQVFHDGRVEAADCPGCSWRAVVQCEMTTAGSCRGPARLCGPEGQWLRVYLTRPGGVEQDLGAACYGPSGPVSRGRVEADLRQVIVEAVPALRPTRRPTGNVLVQLPLYVDAGQQAGARNVDLTIVDLPVQLTLTPRWRWDFGEGRIETSDLPATEHTYRQVGDVVVRVGVIWRGVYWVAGLGPLEIDEPVTQQAALAVPVGQGRAVLVR